MGKIALNPRGSKAADQFIPHLIEEILKADQVADLLGITVEKLRSYNIPRHLVGRNCLYFKSDVIDFVRCCKMRGVNMDQTDW